MTKKIPEIVTSEMIVIAMLNRARKEKHRLILSAPALPNNETQKRSGPVKTTTRAILSERGGEPC